ncbi:methyl-accepting chemotaxis protein [Desulfobacter curvatus]|uniref:methyl-accepting chemotaxis protein n=1 Tax=Desulfobacter curvatus TaxID=2290 RepID=UPI000361C34F|nr:methyl-accepting chemotaxis protein [Desulfobacter curvatus]
MTFKSKLLIGSILSAMLPLVISGYFSINKSSNAITEIFKSQSIQVAKDLAMLAEEVVSQEKYFALSLAKTPVVIQAASKVFDSGMDSAESELNSLENFLADVYADVGIKYESLRVSDKDGNIIADSYDGKAKIRSLAERQYFIDAKKGNISISEPILSSFSGLPIIIIAIPLKTAGGTFTGAFVSGIKLDELSNHITQAKLGKTGYPFVTDQKGIFIAHPNPDLIFKTNMTQTNGMKEAARYILANEIGVLDYTFEGVDKIAGFALVKSTGWRVCVTQNRDEFLETSKHIRNLIFIVGVIAFILVLAGVLWFVKELMVQLGGEPLEIARIADSISEGDLTIQFTGDAEKLTGVYASMKKMTQNLTNMLKEITGGVYTLTSSSTELSAISEQMASNSEATSEKANSVAAASEEMTVNMNGVAAATEQAAANLQTVVAATEEMSSTISEIAANTSKGSQTTINAVKKAEEVSTKVNQLGEAASQISRVTETIADISEQTNLLALNATIEAARAGEAGKGFAVVAAEIKALAHQTAEATKEIGQRIGEVQMSTGDSVTAINEIVEVINEINTIVTSVAAAIEEQTATTQEISNNVSQAGLGVQEVNDNVNQASAVTREVSQNIHQVSQASAEIKTGSLQVNDSAGALSKLAENLNQLISKFTLEKE